MNSRGNFSIYAEQNGGQTESNPNSSLATESILQTTSGDPSSRELISSVQYKFGYMVWYKLLIETPQPGHADKLMKEIAQRQLDCLCGCKIKPNEAVWHCQKCSNPVHTKCVLIWTNEPRSSPEFSDNDHELQTFIEEHAGMQVDSILQHPLAPPHPDSQAWNGRRYKCPLCQEVNTHDPRVYHCGCGKILNPSYFEGQIHFPHCCSSQCLKKPKSCNSECNHTCKYFCHLGKCPSCGRKCGKLLDCGLHRCEKNCHPGDCGSCSKGKTPNLNCKGCYNKWVEFAVDDRRSIDDFTKVCCIDCFGREME